MPATETRRHGNPKITFAQTFIRYGQESPPDIAANRLDDVGTWANWRLMAWTVGDYGPMCTTTFARVRLGGVKTFGVPAANGLVNIRADAGPDRALSIVKQAAVNTFALTSIGHGDESSAHCFATNRFVIGRTIAQVSCTRTSKQSGKDKVGEHHFRNHFKDLIVVEFWRMKNAAAPESPSQCTLQTFHIFDLSSVWVSGYVTS